MPETRVVLDNTINGRNEAARMLLEREGTGHAALLAHDDRVGGCARAGRARRGLDPPLRPRAGRACRFEALDEALRDHWGYQPTTFEDWERRKKRFGFDPGLWLMAVDGDEVAGAAVCQNRSGAGYVTSWP